MIIRVNNMEDGEDTFFEITQEQWWVIDELGKIGALNDDFSISEVELVSLH